jgi:hypothetical protein
VLLAARELVGLLRGFTGQLSREDITLFVVIESESDGLPIGPERQYWNREALARKDVEIARYEAACRPLALAACERILKALTDTEGAESNL